MTTFFTHPETTAQRQRWLGPQEPPRPPAPVPAPPTVTAPPPTRQRQRRQQRQRQGRTSRSSTTQSPNSQLPSIGLKLSAIDLQSRVEAPRLQAHRPLTLRVDKRSTHARRGSEWRRGLLAGRAVGLFAHVGPREHLSPGPLRDRLPSKRPGPREAMATSLRWNPTPATSARSESIR
jgi:hypothetical protein